ncbi:MAG: hypothetical protein CVT95_02155 [Bacteroidetes bacterium HGW-Bacteroidetes-12]|nr:MAG: hypothetical protein CVT95_02155 [Bacteroidetes bacterium HGW-Bacteroidetes-12]
MKQILTLVLVASTWLLYAQQTAFIFQVGETSVNVADGSNGITLSFALFPDTLNFEENDIDSLDVEFVASLDYHNIASVKIEQAMLSASDQPSFQRIASVTTNDTNFTASSQHIENILQGATYVFRLTIETKQGQTVILSNRSTTVDLGNIDMYCAKLNNTYRKACHNCFQQDVIPMYAGGLKGALDYTRVIELDIYSSKVLGGNNDAGIWNVRHGPKLQNNKNNCGGGNRNFNICLQDVLDWHNEPLHEGHDPITIFIDLKEGQPGGQGFWRPGHNPIDLDQLLISTFGAANIYTPKDFAGSQPHLQANAIFNNWPSLGDLKNKFIFVLTGKEANINEYIQEVGLNGIAFVSITATSKNEAQNLSGINGAVKPLITYYNIRGQNLPPTNSLDQLNIAQDVAFPNNLFSRVTTTQVLPNSFCFPIPCFGGIFSGLLKPDDFTNANYRKTIQFQVNYPAPRNIGKNFSHWHNGTFFPENGIFYVPAIAPNSSPTVHLFNNHIFSSNANVTQATINNIATGQLIVEPSTHYRMIAGNSIDLQPGVDIKQGSDVDIRIDDCRYTDYTQRQNTQKGEQLTQEEIDKIMHQLSKELYGYQPESEKEVVNLAVFPNPTNNIINISYTNFLIAPSTFTLFDITGRVVKTKQYTPQNEGKQQFSLTINELNEGTYFYTLQVGEQNYNGKLIKME